MSPDDLTPESVAGPYLVVGLGNPGPEYAGHRHNVGFLVADALADRVGVKFKRHGRAQAEVAEGWLRPGGPKLILAKPLAYMNLSGGPVAALAGFYKIPQDRLVVVHDELDLPFGVVRLKVGGGAGGHNGIRSLAKSLTPDFIRVRVGIGRPPGRQDPADFVLSNFSGAERKELALFVSDAADAVADVAEHGITYAQNLHHSP